MNKILDLFGISSLEYDLTALSISEKEDFLKLYKFYLKRKVKNFELLSSTGISIVNTILLKIFLLVIILFMFGFKMASIYQMNLFLIIGLSYLPLMYLINKTTNILIRFGSQLHIEKNTKILLRDRFNKTRLLLQTKRKVKEKGCFNSRLTTAIQHRKGRKK